MIERTEIDGKKASVAYLNKDFTPATKDDYELVKVLFDDGNMMFAVPSKEVQAQQYEPDGKIKFQGMSIIVENDKGSVREGVDKNTGKPWRTEMRYPYGFVENSKGLDGDAVDVYVGPEAGAKFVFVVHQLNPTTGEWDEDKAMLGFSDAMEAKKAYMIHYDEPEKFYGSLDAVPMDRFKELVMNGGPMKIAGAAFEEWFHEKGKNNQGK
jgi:hypothetical protein